MTTIFITMTHMSKGLKEGFSSYNSEEILKEKEWVNLLKTHLFSINS